MLFFFFTKLKHIKLFSLKLSSERNTKKQTEILKYSHEITTTDLLNLSRTDELEKQCEIWSQGT